MDYKLLGKSVVTVVGASLLLGLAIHGLVWLVAMLSANTIAVLFGIFMLALLVSVDYQRRKFLEVCKK